MSKRLVSFILTVIFMLALAMPVFAHHTITETLEDETSSSVCYPDGSLTVVSAVQIINKSESGDKASGSVTASIPVTHYESNGSLAWKYTLTATFTYNGTTAFCTTASYTNSISNTAWSFSNGSATRAGNVATGRGTYKKTVLGIITQTKQVNVNLTCDPNGNVS